MKEIVFALCVIAAAAIAAFVLTLFFPPELAVEGGVGPPLLPAGHRRDPHAAGPAPAWSVRPEAIGPRKRPTASPMADRHGAVATGLRHHRRLCGGDLRHRVSGREPLFSLLILISFYLSPIAWKRVVTFALPVAAAITAVSYAFVRDRPQDPASQGIVLLEHFPTKWTHSDRGLSGLTPAQPRSPARRGGPRPAPDGSPRRGAIRIDSIWSERAQGRQGQKPADLSVDGPSPSSYRSLGSPKVTSPGCRLPCSISGRPGGRACSSWVPCSRSFLAALEGAEGLAEFGVVLGDRLGHVVDQLFRRGP